MNWNWETALKPTGKARLSNGPALLQCENNPSCGKWVLHNYVCRRFLASSGTDHATGDKEVIYKCSVCGHERRWGLE